MLESSAKDPSVEDTATGNIALHLANNISRTSPSSPTICKTTEEKSTNFIFYRQKRYKEIFQLKHKTQRIFFPF